MKYLYILIICLFVLSACSGEKMELKDYDEPDATTEDETEPGETVEEELEEPVDEPEEPEEEEEPPYVPPEMDEEMQKFLLKSDRVESYSFLRENDDEIQIRGDKVRIILATKSNQRDATFDKIYLDNAEQKAYRYCSENLFCGTKLTQEYREDEYETWKLAKTPFEWLDDIAYAEFTGREMIIDFIDALEMNFVNPEGVNGTMWVHNFYALPTRIIFDGVTTDYTDLRINNIDEEDVTIPEGLTLVE
jgi:hypothetical protein